MRRSPKRAPEPELAPKPEPPAPPPPPEKESAEEEFVDLKEYFGDDGETKKPGRLSAFFRGLLGAILGALPGMIIWVILGKYRIRAAIVGFFLAAGCVKGYTIFTKKNKLHVVTGVLVCSAVIAGTVYLAQRLTLSWLMTDSFEQHIKVMRMDVTQQIKAENPDVPDSVIQNYIDYKLNSTYGFTKGDFSDCFIRFHRILGKLGMTKAYYGDLVQSYVSAAMGAASLLKNAVKKRVKF